MRVSDEAVNRVTEELVINREKKRAIQQMTTKELTAYLVRIYRLGFEAGADAVEQAAEKKKDEALPFVEVDWEDVLQLISEVKGVGPKLTQAIDEKLRREY